MVYSSHDRSEITAAFNRAISESAYSTARDQMLMNAQPGWLYSANDSLRQITVKCMASDAKAIEKKIAATPGVTSVYSKRIPTGALTY